MKWRVIATGSILTVVLMCLFPWALGTDSILATVDITPNTLNLKSKGTWITCRIALPEGYRASDINRTTIRLNGSIPVDPFWVDEPQDFVIPIILVLGSHAHDGAVSHLLVKFNRTAVEEFIIAQGITCGNVTLTITGEVDGEQFEGRDIIRGRMPGDVDSNGVVDIVDVATVAVAFDSTDPYTDLTEDGRTNICDVATVAMNFGKAY